MRHVDVPGVTWTRIGVVDLRRDQERMWFVCRICDTRTDFPWRSEMVDWAGRAFLFVHEHPDQGNELRLAEVKVTLAEYVADASRAVPRQGWPTGELSPLLSECSARATPDSDSTTNRLPTQRC